MRPKSAYPCQGIRRRHFLAGAAALPVLSAVHVSASEPQAAKDVAGKLGLPGPYPGRVIEVRNPRMIKDGVKDREAIKADRRARDEGTHRRRRRRRGLADVLRARRRRRRSR